MLLWIWYFAVPLLVGAFGTAYVHERTGRDPQMGGLIGAAVGLVGSWWLLVPLWIYLYYNRMRVRVLRPRRRWYTWWIP